MIIEGTTRCILECPACPRTWFSEKFNRPFPKQDLDIDAFSRFIDCEAGHSVDHFTFNGNHGDVIYWPQLLEFIDRYRNRTFTISTNGSHQLPKFWEQLASRLTSKDTLLFSIDGLEDTNHLYRRNSNWHSIMQAIDIVKRSDAKLVWKSLVFSTNQHQQQQMADLAQDLGMTFISDVTNRFGDESLRPTNNQILLDRIPDPTIHKIVPRCSELEYISADGYYWPCCMISSMFTLHQTSLWKNRQHWRIDNQTLDQARQTLNQYKQEVLQNPPMVCKMHCKEGQQDFLYTRLDK